MEFLLTLALLGQGTVPGPTGVELEKLWDISVQLPGTTEPLTLNPGAPVPCGAGVVFRAKEFSVPMSWAYHVTSSNLEVFVDEETIIPGTSETFSRLRDVQCSGDGEYSLIGSSGEQALPGGAFSGSPGRSLTLILSNGLTVDGHDIRNWEEASVSENGAVLLGHRNPAFLGTALVMKPAGNPIYVADRSTILPGQTEPVTSYDSPRMMGLGFVFRAQTGFTRGLYNWSEAEGFSLLVDDKTDVPGAPGTFVGVGPITVLAEGVAFSAGFSGGVGVFLVDHQGQVAPLVIPGDQTVEGETILAAFTPRGHGNLVAFRGVSDATAPREGVFARTPDGSIHRIVTEGEVFDSKPADQVFYNADDRSVALRVDTHPPDPADFDQRVYRVTFGDTAVPVEIPALSFRGQALLILLIVLLALWTVRHRKLRTTQ
jgi:hypothetical protein